MGVSAHAAESGHKPPLKCGSKRADFEKELGDIKPTSLTPGQVNFIKGFSYGNKDLLDPPANANGAVVVGDDKGSMIFWIVGDKICNGFSVPPVVIKLMKSAKTGPLDDDGAEI